MLAIADACLRGYFRPMRTLLIAIVMLCAPLSMFVVGWGLFLIYEEAGTVVFVISCASLIVTFAGIALAIDEARQDRTLRKLGL